jgi:hypothetical protein
VVPEPVDKWQNVGNGKVNLLGEFYKDPNRFAYTFQNYVFLTRMVQVCGVCVCVPLWSVCVKEL